MKPSTGSTQRGSSQDNLVIEGQFFLPEWVVGVFYGGRWNDVKEGSLREGILSDYGEMVVYEDPFAGELVFVLEPITGYKVKKPTPPEPQATVTNLFPDKK